MSDQPEHEAALPDIQLFSIPATKRIVNWIETGVLKKGVFQGLKPGLFFARYGTA
ncbi:hypothetical protein [Paracidobacterium acidisoli]|uniref:hypothetical protein n=1 Tax=Paracidobacterium acidisoli TaxID=2303751 RepID=UPI0013143987|nr:hypothetical protein [Paracidobacterium acidisoli]MBT9330228.1 hypothetical protein [Paracidobacterium acidisoli]